MEKNSAHILHIETATNICSVALSRNGNYLHHITESGTLQHASITTVLVERLLKEAGLSMADLEAVSLSEGPGSYTSLRVGMSVAKGICYGLDIPLIAVNTLEALAFAAREEQEESDYICAMIDARRMEVYASLYDRSMNRLIDNEALIMDENSFDEYLDKGSTIVICGNGGDKLKPLYKGKNIRFSVEDLDARYLIKPAQKRFIESAFADLAYFSPNYIKSPNITKAKKKIL